MIKLSKQGEESLNEIRAEIEQQQCSKANYNHLSLLWEEITASVGNKRILDISCGSCIQTAIKSVYNYITYHEGKQSSKPKPELPKEEIVSWTKPKETTVLKSIDEIRKEYEDITGKKPHHKMKGEKMLKEIDEIKNA